MSKFCSKCGTPIEEGARFCAVCGSPVPAAVQPQPAQSPVQPIQKPVQQLVQQPVQQPAQQPRYNYAAPNSAAPARPYAPQQPAQRPQYNYGTPNNAARPYNYAVPNNAAPAQPYAQQQPVQQPYNYAAPNSAYAPNGQQYYGAAPQPKKSKKGMIIGIAIAAAVVIVGVVLLIVLLGGSKGASSPEELVSKLESLCNSSSPSKNDIAGISYSYVFAKDETAQKAEYESIDTTARINDSTKLMYGDDAHFTIEILDDETEVFDAEKLAERIAQYTSQGYRDTDKIEEIRRIKLRVTIAGSKGTDSMTEKYTIVKVDGKWYVY